MSAPENQLSDRELPRGAGGERLRAWLQLVRAPNLLSAYGDPIAGACLAGALESPGAVGRVLLAAVVSVAVYAAGVVDNDLVDMAEDGRDRPDRPLPSGAVKLAHARAGRILLFLAPYLIALVCPMPPAWLVAHALLLLTCLSYNRLKGRFPRMGVTLMGLCRGLSMFSGVTLGWAVGGVALWPLSAVLPWWAYVTGLTLFAAKETTRAPGAARYLLALPPLALAAGAGLPATPHAASLCMLFAGLCGTALALDVATRLRGVADPGRVPPLVGRLVRALIPMQALLALSAPAIYGIAFCALLLVTWPLSERVARRFYAS